MKSSLITLLLSSVLTTQGAEYSGKGIYIPHNMSLQSLRSDTAKWSLSRMVQTENVALFWAPGFGQDITNAPELEGHDMRVNQAALLARLEELYRCYYHDLAFVKAGQSKADRWKMMVMLDYSLEGTAYGGTYDNEIGALWVTPLRLQDPDLNCVAHELGHSFQLQIPADGAGEAWGGSGFFEMTSQWMLWHVNPRWIDDERYHLEAFRQHTHKAFLSLDNIYRSPYVIEWWSELYGVKYIAELYRNGRKGEDPAMTHMRLQGLTQSAFCKQLMQAYQHLVGFDFRHAYSETRPHAHTFHTDLEPAEHKGWLCVGAEKALEDYGFHVFSLAIPEKKSNFAVSVRSLRADRPVMAALVAALDDGSFLYGDPVTNGRPSIRWRKRDHVTSLSLVVMGCPTEHVMLPNDRTYPFEIKMK